MKPLKNVKKQNKTWFQNKSNAAQTTKTKVLKQAKESKQNKTTVKQSLQGNVDWQFCLCGFAYLR